MRENPRSWQEFQDILHWEYCVKKIYFSYYYLL